MPLMASVPATEYIMAVNLAPVSLSEPNESWRPMTALLRASSGLVVIWGHVRVIDEDAQPLAVVEQRAQRLGP